MIRVTVAKNTIPMVAHEVIDNINIQTDVVALKMASTIRTAKEYIAAGLRQMFPDSGHFLVEMQALGPTAYDVSIYADEIGGYIYYGTSSHNISANRAMPLGESRFASSVSHPGTMPRKDEIDKLVENAMRTIWLESSIWGF